MKKRLLRYFLIHLALACLLAVLACAFFVSRKVTEATGIRIPTCPLHDLLGIYCPFCGGTRATLLLLSGDPLGALRANAAVVVTLPFLLWWDVAKLIRLLRDRPTPSRSRLSPVVFLILFAVFFVLRNLLVLFGIDPTGDFLP